VIVAGSTRPEVSRLADQGAVLAPGDQVTCRPPAACRAGARRGADRLWPRRAGGAGRRLRGRGASREGQSASRWGPPLWDLRRVRRRGGRGAAARRISANAGSSPRTTSRSTPEAAGTTRRSRPWRRSATASTRTASRPSSSKGSHARSICRSSTTPGDMLGLCHHGAGEFRVARRLIGEPLPARVHDEPAVRDHDPGAQDPVRGRYRAMALVRVQVANLSAQPLADEEGVTLAGVAAKVQRVLDLGNELVDQAPARVRATGSVAGRARQPV
jgi:hypothetical protein